MGKKAREERRQRECQEQEQEKACLLNRRHALKLIGGSLLIGAPVVGGGLYAVSRLFGGDDYDSYLRSFDSELKSCTAKVDMDPGELERVLYQGSEEEVMHCVHNHPSYNKFYEVCSRHANNDCKLVSELLGVRMPKINVLDNRMFMGFMGRMHKHDSEAIRFLDKAKANPPENERVKKILAELETELKLGKEASSGFIRNYAREMGFYSSAGEIYIYPGIVHMDPNKFRYVTLHESAHAVHGQNFPKTDSQVVTEGFAEYIAIKHGRNVGISEDFLKEKENNHHSNLERGIVNPYSLGYIFMKILEKRGGLERIKSELTDPTDSGKIYEVIEKVYKNLKK